MMKSCIVSGLLAITGYALAQPPTNDLAPASVFDASPTAPAPLSRLPSSIGMSSDRDFRVATTARFFTDSRSATKSKAEIELQNRIGRASSQIAAEEKSVRDQAVAELQKSLEELFDLRTVSRQEQIVDLEKRLQKLRDQLEERKSRKSEIVDLRLRILLNEANGLTF